MKTIKAYTIDSQRAFLNYRDVRENPRRENDYPHAPGELIDCDELPEYTEYQIPVLKDDKTWEVKDDYRNVSFYSKETGEEQDLITEVGETPDFTLYTLHKPSTEFIYQKFDDESDSWVEDTDAKTEAKKNNSIIDLKAQIQTLELKQMRYLKEMLSGSPTDEGKALYDGYEAELISLRTELQELLK